MTFSVQILGSNSALAAHGRHPTAQVVQYNNAYFLIDCGEGTQMRMSNFHVKRSKINQIFISHLHGDHYFGLIGLITSYQLMGRTNKLTIFGPAPLENIILAHLNASSTTLNYDLDFVVTKPNGKNLIFESDELCVYTFPLQHRIDTTGFLFLEKVAPRRINGEVTKDLKLSRADFEDLKLGLDVTVEGKQLSNASLTLPSYPSRSYAFCSDTVFLPELKEVIEGVDLLYHEATFTKEAVQKAIKTNHSTTEQAAKIANIVNAKQLIIGHFSSKYIDLQIPLNEAKSVFANTHLAIEGTTFEIYKQKN